MTLSCWALIRSDIKADPRNPKGLLVCTLYRVAHSVTRWPKWLLPLGYVGVAVYKAITEYVLGTEIHWRATIGPGLRVYHGYGLVVHSNSVIGRNCTLRHGVTIGAKDAEGLLVPVIGDDVEVGVGALVIGAHTIGDGARIGAGTVVVSDVPAGATVVGNPGRILNHAS